MIKVQHLFSYIIFKYEYMITCKILLYTIPFIYYQRWAKRMTIFTSLKVKIEKPISFDTNFNN